MRNPFKSKSGEKQSLLRLMVIAGRTFVSGTVVTFVWCMLNAEEPRHPLTYICFAVGGFLLWLVGTIMAEKAKSNQETPEKKPFFSWGGILLLILFLMLLLGLSVTTIDKPVIYLYPQQKEDVLVQLAFAGKITADYPALDPALEGWKVTAFPDGHLVDPRDGREYSYLFWEGEGRTDWDWSSGFVVKGSDTRQFLEDTLPKLGLTAREYNDFIVYWYPKMQDNSWNLVHFAGHEYTDTARLTVTPEPDTVIRVFMVWKPLGARISLPPQTFPPVERKGFTVVEWGGTEEK